MNNIENNQPQIATTTLDEGKLYQYRERLRFEQNLPLALLSGLIAALIGAFLWAAITVVTNYQIGYMAVGVGFLVGYTVRFFGKGIDAIFGVSGAFMSLLGCLVGNFLSLVGFVSNEEGFSYLEVLKIIDYSLVPAAMMESFNPIDILFYGIAIYEGYRFAFRHVTEEEIVANAAKV